jgi:hypothetical protein
MRLQLKTVNSGPFKMYQVLDNCKKPARVLMTTSDEDEAKDFINREVEDMQWRAANRD